MTVGSFKRKVKGGLIVHLIPKVAHSIIAIAIGDHLTKMTYNPDDKHLMVVRHPLDRIVSGYAFFTQVKGELHDFMKELGYRKDMTFDRWLNVLEQQYEHNVHTQKQIDFIDGDEIDFLIPVEKLTEFWPKIQKEFHVDALKESRANKSAHNQWENYYTEQQRAKMEDIFKEDLELYKIAVEKYNG